MSLVSIEESGLTFGPYPASDCFLVERSSLYRRLGEGVKMVEFLLVRPGRADTLDLLCVEAKRSVPRPASPHDFERFFFEVREKMLNALLLLLAVRLGRHGADADEVPARVRALDLQTMQVRFVLVVGTAEESWLPPLQDKLRQVLQPVLRSFGIAPSGVAVLDAGRARAERLVAP